jgi:hypothetical protein
MIVETKMDKETKKHLEDWYAGKLQYKSFRAQFLECEENGTLFEEKCPHGHELLMCKRYGGQCISRKCKNARVLKDEQNNNRINMDEVMQVTL